MGRITEAVKVLIIINVLFFVGKVMSPELFDRLFSLYFYKNPNFQFWQPITHMFMHGDIGHIFFNMFGLFMFGSPLETRWGTKKFLFFYFSAGLGAALVHTLVNYYQFHNGFDILLSLGQSESIIWSMLHDTVAPGSYRDIIQMGDAVQPFFNSWNIPALGASGAVYGVLVAFGVLFPNTPLMLIFFPVPIKAKYFIPVMILGDLFFGISGAQTGIAHFAHIGGALFGFIMAYYWMKNDKSNLRWD